MPKPTRDVQLPRSFRTFVQQTQLAVGGPEQHDAGIAGHAAAVKLALHHPPAQTAKFDRGLQFLVYSLALAPHLVIGFRYQ